MDALKPPSIFISYSHADADDARLLAATLSGMGVKIWMDTKELRVGETLIDTISSAINDSDLYVIVLSEASIASKWVTHELNLALSLEISRGHPQVVPVMLSNITVPPALRSKLYIDLSKVTFSEAGRQIYNAIRGAKPELSRQDSNAILSTPAVTLASIVLELRAKTSISYGGIENDHTKADVEEEADRLLKQLRRRANGILLNFVAVSEMDFNSPHPRFPNGEVSSYARPCSGELIGTSGRSAVVEVTVLKPDEKRLNELVSTKLSSLGVGKAVYSFLVDPPVEGLGQKSLKKIQDNYVILGWDNDEGANVELPDDLRLSVFCSDDNIRISMETEYQFQFERRAKEFSVREFANWLIKP